MSVFKMEYLYNYWLKVYIKLNISLLTKSVFNKYIIAVCKTVYYESKMYCALTAYFTLN